MRLEIDIAEHHYNNIMALDSVSLGRVPYKGIIMYSINAIKHGKVLDQEPTTKNDLGVDCIDKSTECKHKCIDNDLGVDCISRQAVLDLIADYDLSMGQVVRGIHALPSVTPQPRKGHWVLRNSFLVPYKCSECNYESERYDNYCPNCGADMREVEE